MKVGIVLNGGKSTRMGQDKAQLKISGHSLLEQAKIKLQSCSLDAVVESGSLEGIQDTYEHKGPVGGIYSVINSLGLQCGDILLVVPNDMPALKERTMNVLLQTCTDRKESCIFSRFYLPVAIYLDERHLAFASTIREKQGLPLRELLRASSLIQLDESSVNIELREFININTPQDWDTFTSVL